MQKTDWRCSNEAKLLPITKSQMTFCNRQGFGLIWTSSIIYILYTYYIYYILVYIIYIYIYIYTPKNVRNRRVTILTYGKRALNTIIGRYIIYIIMIYISQYNINIQVHNLILNRTLTKCFIFPFKFRTYLHQQRF